MDSSFSLILPSNSSTNRFPANNAASFSIAYDDAERLHGNWEVAISHVVYSNCLYTFNNETIKIEQERSRVNEWEYGCRVTVPTKLNTTTEPVEGLTVLLNYFNKVHFF